MSVESLAAIDTNGQSEAGRDKSVGRLGMAYRFEESAHPAMTPATSARTPSRGVRATVNE